MEDGISGGLQHRHMTCCEKGGRHGRRACRVQRWHHCGDVVFRTGGLVYDTDGCFNDNRLKCESELYDGKTGDVIITADRSCVACT